MTAALAPAPNSGITVLTGSSSPTRPSRTSNIMAVAVAMGLVRELRSKTVSGVIGSRDGTSVRWP